MAKKAGFVRTTISVPADLKKRMDKISEDVNWSALACQAFEGKLAEVISKKGAKDMEEVLARLRESERQSASDATKAGYEAGQEWVKHHAQVSELRRLDKYWHSVGENDRWVLFAASDTPGVSGPPAWESLAEAVQPDGDAKEFWEVLLGDDIEQADDSDFMKGFFDGAFELWADLKRKL